MAFLTVIGKVSKTLSATEEGKLGLTGAFRRRYLVVAKIIPVRG